MCSSDAISPQYMLPCHSRQSIRHPKLVCIAVAGPCFPTSVVEGFFANFGLSVVAEVGVNVVVAIVWNAIYATHSLPERRCRWCSMLYMVESTLVHRTWQVLIRLSLAFLGSASSCSCR